jgi:paraquat-inducible protein B
MSCFDLDHIRLGAFLVIGAALLATVVLFFSVRDRQREDFLVVTYFDEHVTGLEGDAPVRYRGVEVGRVRHITIAPDKIRVEVLLGLHLDDLRRIGLDPATMRQQMRDERQHLGGEGLRATLQGNLVTGKLFVQLDIHRDPPAPFVPMGFVPEHPYLPSARSSLKSFEMQVMALLGRMPATLDKVDAVLTQAEAKLAEVDARGLGDRAQSLLRHAEEQLLALDLPALADAARTGLTTVTARAGTLAERLDRLLADEGPVATLAAALRRAADEVSRTVHEAAITDTVAAVQGAAANLRNLLDEVRLLVSAWEDAGGGLSDTLRQLRTLGADLAAEPESLLFGPRALRKED